MEPIFEIRESEDEAILIFEDGRVEGIPDGLTITNRIRPRLDALTAQLAWQKMPDKAPTPGQLIVKRWTNGNVWAGVYTGGPKEGSFDEWKAL